MYIYIYIYIYIYVFNWCRNCALVQKSVAVMLEHSSMGLIHQSFLRLNYFLKPTCAVFTKTLTFINVFSSGICSYVRTESTHTEEYSYAHLITERLV